jgi:hypothetical protein
MICPGKRWPKRRTERNALLMDALIKLSKEECALDMGQRGSTENALLMDAQILLIKEECAGGMGRGPNAAV